MIVTISGLPGSGTSSVAKYVSELLNLKIVSAGDLFREAAKDAGMSLSEYGLLADSDSQIDLSLDYKMQNAVRENGYNLILEGRLAAYNASMVCGTDVIKILLVADMNTRADRISKRDNVSFREALDQTMFRENHERKRHRETYGTDISSIEYDAVFNSKTIDIVQISAMIYDLFILKSAE